MAEFNGRDNGSGFVHKSRFAVRADDAGPMGEYLRKHGLPGEWGNNPIPPTDTAEYRFLQRLFGLRKDEYVSQLRWAS